MPMKTVRILRDETISFGPMRLLAGQVIELPEAWAAGLIGRQVAEEATEGTTTAVGTDEAPPVAPDIHDGAPDTALDELEQLSRKQLIQKAYEAGITGVSKASRADLISALMAPPDEG